MVEDGFVDVEYRQAVRGVEVKTGLLEAIKALLRSKRVAIVGKCN